MRTRPQGGTFRNLALLAGLSLILITLATARDGDRRLYPPRPDEAVTVYLIDNGFHTDLALPREALRGHLIADAARMATDKPWVAVGWGDQRFFIERGLSARRVMDGLRALFAPSNPSAVRLDGLARRPDEIYAARAVRPLRLSRAGLARLAARLDASLARDAAGRPVRTPAPAAPDTAFFKSVEAFSLLHLCNHWTAELLNAAGVPTTPVLDTFAPGLRVDLAVRAGA
jgi:uncharacterized protein (TIGR02117 family)